MNRSTPRFSLAKVTMTFVALAFFSKADAALGQVIYLAPAPQYVMPFWYPVPTWQPVPRPVQKPESEVVRNYPSDASTAKTVIIERYYLDDVSDGKAIRALGEAKTEYTDSGVVIYREYYLTPKQRVPSSSTESDRKSGNEILKTLPKEADDISPPLEKKPLNLRKPITVPSTPESEQNVPLKSPPQMEPAKRYN